LPDTRAFAIVLLISAIAATGAIVAARVTERIKVPSPALVLIAAAIAVKVFPVLHPPPGRTVERVVTVALVVILFEGGMHMGWKRVRQTAGPIVSAGVIGTVLTAAGGAVVIRLVSGFSWYLCLLVATAVAPTDPAVVFSVLGRHEVDGPAGTILEGESGANDPVGIALLASLLSATSLTWSATGSIAGEFAAQMGVGLAVGVIGGFGLLWFMRRVPLPAEGLYPLRTLAGALVIYAVAAIGHGSGFLAVFAAGVLLGDRSAPFKREIERFHSALAGLAELVAFVVLGLTVDLNVLVRQDVWIPGLVLGLALALVLRPLSVGLSLLPFRLAGRQLAFVLFAGLKGAVPILLGTSLLAAGVDQASRLFGIVVVVVVFSVVVQGGLVPAAAQLLRLPLRDVEPQPWAVGVRLQERPEGVHQLKVAPGSPADGETLAGLAGLPPSSWVTLVVRDGSLVPARGDTTLRSGDVVLVLAQPDELPALRAVFSPSQPP